MSEGKEGILGDETPLRDFLERTVYMDDYDEEEERLTKLAGKFETTPLQMGQLDLSLTYVDY